MLMLGGACAPPEGGRDTAGADAQLDRTVLPIAEPEVATITTLDARDAKAPPRFAVKAPQGAPNVVIVLIDDIGFGASSAFGGPIRESAFQLDPAIGAVISSVVVNKEHEGITELQLVTPADCTLRATELRTKLLHSFFFRMPGCILRAAILQGHEPPDPQLYQIHDWEYFLRVMHGHKARLLHAPGAVYRIHDKSITATAQFDNRLYNDIQRWLTLAQQPGDRHIEEAELRRLHRSCADLMMIGFGPKFGSGIVPALQ